MAFNDFTSFHHLLSETVDQHPNAPAYQWFTPNGDTASLSGFWPMWPR